MPKLIHMLRSKIGAETSNCRDTSNQTMTALVIQQEIDDLIALDISALQVVRSVPHWLVRTVQQSKLSDPLPSTSDTREAEEDSFSDTAWVAIYLTLMNLIVKRMHKVLSIGYRTLTAYKNSNMKIGGFSCW